MACARGQHSQGINQKRRFEDRHKNAIRDRKCFGLPLSYFFSLYLNTRLFFPSLSPSFDGFRARKQTFLVRVSGYGSQNKGPRLLMAQNTRGRKHLLNYQRWNNGCARRKKCVWESGAKGRRQVMRLATFANDFQNWRQIVHCAISIK